MQQRILVLIVLLGFAALSGLQAQQSLALYDIDTTDYPLMRASVYAGDHQGRLIQDLVPADVSLRENGAARTLMALEYGGSAPRPVSIAIGLDRSALMAIGPAGNTPFDRAMESIALLADNTAESNSETALQSCNMQAFIDQDFTANRQFILNAMFKIRLENSYDLAEHLLNPIGGLLAGAQSGRNRRVAVLLTSGAHRALNETQYKQVINLCTQYDIRFCALIFRDTEQEPGGALAQLQTLASYTGGLVLENILTPDDARAAARALQEHVQEFRACTIRWLSTPECEPVRRIELNYPRGGLRTERSITLRAEQFSFGTVQPATLQFGAVAPGQSKRLSFELRAGATELTVYSIGQRTGEPFSLHGIAPGDIPFTLPAGGSRSFTIEYQPADSGYVWDEFRFETSSCRPTSVHLSAGFPNKAPVNPRLRLLAPLGGDTIGGNDVQEIRWEGVTPEDYVALDFSTDGGAGWQTITRRARGLRHTWSIPNMPDKRFAIRLSQQHNSFAGGDTLRQYGGPVDGSWTAYAVNPAQPFFAIGAYCFETGQIRPLRIFNYQSGEIVQDIYSDNIVRALAWSPDGRYLASFDSDSLLTIRDSRNWQPKLINRKSEYNFTRLRWHPSGQYLLGFGGSGMIAIWRFGPEMARIEDGPELSGYYNVRDIHYSPDGKYIALSTRTGNLALFDAYSGEPIFEKGVDGTGIGLLGWTADSRRIAALAHTKVLIWDVASGEEIRRHDFGNEYFQSLSVDPSGDRILLGRHNGPLFTIDPLSGEQELLFDETSRLISVWSGDGRYILAQDVNGAPIELVVYRAADAGIARRIVAYGRSAEAVRWSPDGSTIATGGDYGITIVREASTGEILRRYTDHTGTIYAMDWSADGALLATAGGDGKIIVRDVQADVIRYEFSDEDIGEYADLDFHPHGTYLAAAGADKGGAVWNLHNGLQVTKIEQKTSDRNYLRWSPDGAKLVAGNGTWGAIVFYAVDTWKALDTIHPPSHLIGGTGPAVVEWSPDGTRFLTAGSPFAIQLWNAATGKLLDTLRLRNDAEARDFMELAYSPDGTKIAASNGGSIVVWDAASLALKGIYGSYFSDPADICWSPDSKLLASVSTFGHALQLWEVDGALLQSDESAAVLIQGGALDIKPLVFPLITAGTSGDTVLQAALFNPASRPVRVEEIEFRNTSNNRPSQEFSLLSGYPPFVILPGESKTLALQFHPGGNEKKQISAQCRVSHQYGLNTQTYTGRVGDYFIVPDRAYIDFDTVYFGSAKTHKDLRIRNESDSIVHIGFMSLVGPAAAQFNILSEQAQSLAPNASFNPEIQFAPTRPGRTGALLQLHYNQADSVYAIPLYGIGVDPSTPVEEGRDTDLMPAPSVYIGSISPNPAGERITVAIAGALPNGAQLIVTDVQGRSLHTQIVEPDISAQTSLSLDVGALAPGVYYVHLHSTDVAHTASFILLR